MLKPEIQAAVETVCTSVAGDAKLLGEAITANARAALRQILDGKTPKEPGLAFEVMSKILGRPEAKPKAERKNGKPVETVAVAQ